MDVAQLEFLDQVFKHVAKLHHQTVSRLFADKEVFPGQPPLLRLLTEQDGRSQRELAERMGIAPATLNVMIGRMEKYGLVERRPDPDDQRISRVYILEKGRAAHNEIRSVIETMEATCFKAFTVEEKIIFRRLLLQMHENLTEAGREAEQAGEAPHSHHQRGGRHHHDKHSSAKHHKRR